MRVRTVGLLVVVLSVGLVLGACGSSSEPADDEVTSGAMASTTVAQAVTGSTVPTEAVGTGDIGHEAIGEAFVQAFYSFDRAALEELFVEGSATEAVYYQGFAEGANYRIFERPPCALSETSPDYVICPVTVEDDAMMALSTEIKVTDTFLLTIEDGLISGMSVTTDDPPIIQQAVGWFFGNHPELFEGACQGMWRDGETPGDCSRAVVEGVREYAALNDITP